MIRHANPTDCRRIAEIQVASWRAAYRGIFPDDYLEALDIGTREKRWLGFCENSGSRLLAAWADEQIVGFCHVGPSRDKGGKSAAEITAIYLDPEHWRKGHGRELIAAAISFAEDYDLDEITLWVLRENHPAKRFYEAMGFSDDGATQKVERAGVPLLQNRYRRNIGAPLVL